MLQQAAANGQPFPVVLLDFMMPGSPNRPAPELKVATDVTADPRFVDAEHDDFRLRPDTILLNRGGFRYLGALPPVQPSLSKHP